MLRYKWKPLDELVWAVVVAGATVLLLELVGLQTDQFGSADQVRTWALALAVGAVRAMAGAALDWIRRSLSQPDAEPTLADEIMALTPAERAVLLAELEHRQRVRTIPGGGQTNDRL